MTLACSQKLLAGVSLSVKLLNNADFRPAGVALSFILENRTLYVVGET